MTVGRKLHKPDVYKLSSALIAIGIVSAFQAPEARADFTQSFGISTKCLANAGACVASSADYASFYHNPAGAAHFDSVVIGGGLQTVDTRGLDYSDATGSFSPVNTSIDGVFAALPSLGFYKPINDKLVLGLGIGSPFGIVADWDDQSLFQTNVADQSLISLNASPTVAYNFSDKLRLGGALNVSIARQLGIGINLDPLGLGFLRFSTDNEIDTEGVPPGGFDFGLHSVSFTGGLQYDVNDRLTVGLTGRTRERQTFDGFFTQTVGGTAVDSTRFTTSIDGPGHIQAGLTFELLPKLDVSFDYQRTFWSSTRGLGQPFVVNFDAPILGGLVNDINVDFAANDTNTFRLGLTYEAIPGLDLRFGYAFDESAFPDEAANLLTFSSDRHQFAAGFSYDTTKGKGGKGWEFDGAFLLTTYIERDIPAGSSTNSGGLGGAVLAGGIPAVSPTATFGPNPSDVQFDGNIYLFSLGATYKF